MDKSWWIKARRLFLSVKSNDALDGALTNRAKLATLIGAHSAIGCGAIESLAHIPRSLINADTAAITLGRRCRDGGAGRQHVFPLCFKVDERSDVGFPWLSLLSI